MAVAITKPSGESRVDDVRALRFRLRDLTFSGTYAAGGETVTAAQVGLKRILFATPQSPVTVGSTPTTGTPTSVVVAADGSSAAVRQYEEEAVAAGGPLLEKGATAYLTGSSARILFIGY